jgi:hypothetical protein
MKLFLQIINAGSSIDPLIKRGLTYFQIASMLNDAKSCGYIKENDGKLVLSESGQKMMRCSGESSRTDGGWISPSEESKIPKKSIFDIYLPSQKESFLAR